VADLELLTFKLAQMDIESTDHQDSTNPPLLIASVGGSLLMRSLQLLEEMIDNHEADAVPMSEQHYKEVKKLLKDIRKSKRLQ
jgi:hypothetical protein